MELNKKTKYLTWEMWGTAAFWTFCLATIFMVFFSTLAIQVWPHPWNRLSMLTACLLPTILVIVWKLPEWISIKEIKKELLFIPIIIAFGIFNIIFSENRAITFKVMSLFLMTGIGIFGTASSVLCNRHRQIIFLWMCWSCLLILCAYGILEHTKNEPIHLLSFNPIPAGSLLILLFTGPFLLFPAGSNRLRVLLFASVVAGIAIIIMIGKQGPALGIIGMVFFAAIMMPRQKMVWVVLMIALILTGTGYIMRNHLPSTLTRDLIGSRSLRERLENYPLAAHIFLKKPIFGIGLHAPIDGYLKDYRRHLIKDQEYSEYIKEDKTLENIILCGFAEMGGIFTITYITLIFYLLKNLFRLVKEKPEQRISAVLLLTPLFGFFIHSMSFDSLIFPHLNWLFHSYLGIMASFNKNCLS